MNIFGDSSIGDGEQTDEDVKVNRMKVTFAFLNAINYSKEDILEEIGEEYYNMFYINRFLSGKLDAVLYANEMNIRAHTLTKRMHFDYLKNGLRKDKRYSKWMKGTKDKNVGVIQKFYGYSWNKAREVLNLITEENINTMEKMMYNGGLKK